MISLDRLRRDAKALKKGFVAGDEATRARVRVHLGNLETLKHADALHVIAREQGFDSWPKLKFAAETLNMDRAEKAERLKIALYLGQHWITDALLAETPDLGRDRFGLTVALYDVDHVRAVLARDPAAATRVDGVRTPMTHLTFSQHIHNGGDAKAMIEVADALVAAGADVNDAHLYDGDPTMPLSALYGALGHAKNLELAEWLLDRGADPNDNESLYHSTELGDIRGLKMLLDHGAKVAGTNAIPRALDFNNHDMVRRLLDAGGDPNEGIAEHPSGEAPFVIPTLHQAARRMCDGEMIALLLDAGAEPSALYKGITPYAMARVYGNREAAERIAAAGGETRLGQSEALLAAAADGDVPDGEYVDTSALPDEFRGLLRHLVHMPERLPHIQRLVAIGLEWDRPDPEGLTPVQVAGWEGLPEIMGYFLRLKPDLGHVNNYGGRLLGTIIHGSENCGARAERDHIACARLALDEGVALPLNEVRHAGDPDMAAFLADWAEAHPGQVVEEGPA